MDKPLSLAIEDAKNSIITAINESKLTPVLLKPIVKEIYDEIVVLSAKEIQDDRIKFEKSLKEQKEQAEEKSEDA